MSEADWRLIKVRVKDIAELGRLKDPGFITCIQLSRMANALRTWLRVHYHVSETKRAIHELVTFKTRYDVTLIHAAVLAECMKNFIRLIEPKLPRFLLESYDLYCIGNLRKRFEDRDEPFISLLKKVRDKIAFHFDEDVVTKTLDSMPLSDKNAFAQGPSPTKHDLFFSLADDIVINYLILHRPADVEENEVWDWFSDNVIEQADDLASLCENIMSDILNKKLFAQEETESKKSTATIPDVGDD